MIRVRLKGAPGKIEGFMIWGHSGSAPMGKDIVCAGVSAIAIAALIGLRKRCPEGIRYCVAEGLIYCKLGQGHAGDGARDAQVILDTMFHGLESIRQSYGKYIDLALRR